MLANRFKFYFVLSLFVFKFFISGMNYDISSKVLNRGEFIRINIFFNQKIDKGTLYFAGKRFHLFEKKLKNSGYHYFSYVAVSRYDKKKSRILKFYARFKGEKIMFLENIELTQGEERPLKPVNIGLSLKKKKLVSNRSSLGYEVKMIQEQVVKHLDTTKHISEGFKLPLKGAISSPFGKLRSYTSSYVRRHSGVDIVNKEGAKIYAPAAGKIVLNENFKIHGRTIMINHGSGFVSIFNHLSSSAVKVGQEVSKGDFVARVGTTGVSTSPHLHWSLAIQSVRIDPMYAIKNKALFDNLKGIDPNE